MLIDNTLRKRWKFTQNNVKSLEADELLEEVDTNNQLIRDIEIQNRFNVSAQEWLLTWRTIE